MQKLLELPNKAHLIPIKQSNEGVCWSTQVLFFFQIKEAHVASSLKEFQVDYQSVRTSPKGGDKDGLVLVVLRL